MAKKNVADESFQEIPFRMHPRVFAALGADLVTNDVVAVIELVKNSYDAFAENVWISFELNEENEVFLEIKDDGCGMTRKEIEEVWCVVATPNKRVNTEAVSGDKIRRVAGEKGLGRLSAARLGNRFQMVTQTNPKNPWEVEVDWNEIAGQTEMSSCNVRVRPFKGKPPLEKSGTRIRVFELSEIWDEDKIADLEDNLARLISPFEELDDFAIHLSRPGESDEEEPKIESPDFLSEPKYCIAGNVDGKGNITATYKYAPFFEGSERTQEINFRWEQVFDSMQDKRRFPFGKEKAHCGEFKFEIRAWDLAAADTEELATRYDIQKSKIRKAIRAHKGISVYRDGILVLPKSDNARDWLGLDLRRVSRVGTRLSTSQIVGYVSISADSNEHIGDTSDRERLVSRLEVAEFEEILKTVIALLENARDEDREKQEREKPIDDLFSELSADDILSEIQSLADEGALASDALPALRAFHTAIDKTRREIQDRFVYYSRLATIGTIAQMLVHEIRNRTGAFGNFLDTVKKRIEFPDGSFEKEYKSADTSVDSLERLADTFAPLASRAFRKRKRHSILEDRIRECVFLVRRDMVRKKIRYAVPHTETHVAVDPGELDSVILNLLTNAIFWLGQVNEDKRKITFNMSSIHNGTRIKVWVHDTGPGIDDDFVDKIFLPGTTRRPNGIGMGLTVASDLVSSYGGQIAVKHPGTKGGASFFFDLPLKK